jgi:hypothetical protein
VYIVRASAKLLHHPVPLFTAPIVGIVDDTLPPGFKEVPDELLAAIQNLLAQFDGLRAFLSYGPGVGGVKMVRNASDRSTTHRV